mgnify:CR=1 FL=1
MATESTNTDTKSGAGRMVAFVLIGLALLAFIAAFLDDYAGGLAIHPMDQFVVAPLFGDGSVGLFTITNATLWMGLSVVCVLALMVWGTRGRNVVPSRSQSIAELAYGFVRGMVEDVAGKDALPYFPYIFTLFLYILFANFLGLIPTSFTTTSHIAVTAILAMAVFLTVTILGFVKNGATFLSLFWVSSAPLALRPVLAVIELISYFVRPVSHSIRLGANMMAGHAVLKVLGGFVGAMGFFGFLPILGITAMTLLEFVVAILQAYVFAILTCVYLNDSLNLH